MKCLEDLNTISHVRRLPDIARFVPNHQDGECNIRGANLSARWAEGDAAVGHAKGDFRARNLCKPRIINHIQDFGGMSRRPHRVTHGTIGGLLHDEHHFVAVGLGAFIAASIAVFALNYGGYRVLGLPIALVFLLCNFPDLSGHRRLECRLADLSYLPNGGARKPTGPSAPIVAAKGKRPAPEYESHNNRCNDNSHSITIGVFGDYLGQVELRRAKTQTSGACQRFWPGFFPHAETNHIDSCSDRSSGEARC